MRLLLFVLCLALALIGCSKRPSGFPEVFPCTITVLNNGVPEAGVDVVLSSMGTPHPNSACSGVTNAHGHAVIYTVCPPMYSEKGVPVGEYAIAFNKSDVIEGAKSKQEIAKMSPDEYEAYTKLMDKNRKSATRIIPEQLRGGETSPLRVTVEKTGSNLSCDLKDYPDIGKKR